MNESNTSRRFNHLLKLIEWGVDGSTAEIILDCILNNSNILITGPVGSGKTLLLKELISMKDPDSKFGYLYRHPSEIGLSNYGIHPSDIHRVSGSVNMATTFRSNWGDQLMIASDSISLHQTDFFVVDDVTRDDFSEITDFLSSIHMNGTLGTCFLRNEKDALYVFRQQQQYYDLMVYVQSYKHIENVRYRII